MTKTDATDETDFFGPTAMVLHTGTGRGEGGEGVEEGECVRGYYHLL
jgi:hypothetical protein